MERGPLQKGVWWKTMPPPKMCAYKVVTGHFKWRGLQSTIEGLIMRQYPRLFTKFHREVHSIGDYIQ